MTGEEQNLISLGIMRDFVAMVVPADTYLENLVIDKLDDSNLRLWALRESLKVDEASFARKLGLSQAEYHGLERRGTVVPREFLERAAGVFGVPLDWLVCKQPFLPRPCASRS